jgi:tRNA pseudouridine55 synthase
LLVIDKPAGMTSRDALNRAQRWFPRGTKIGHTGTLDPLATGVLVACVGRATKLADRVQAMGKAYRATVRLGATSSSDDADGVITPTPGAEPPSRERVEAELARFVGVGPQLPPQVSALKVGGRRAHAIVRSGGVAAVEPRPVRIDVCHLVDYQWPLAEIEVECGKGTYIRSIARDLGAALGVGGLVLFLRRTRVGPFTAEQGVTLEATADEARQRLLPASVVFGS